MSDLNSILSSLGAGTVPDEATLDQMVGSLTRELGLKGSNLASYTGPKDAFSTQMWNVGELSKQLGIKTSQSDIITLARQMFANYATLTPQQQQIANQMANVSLLASLNRSRAKGDQLQAGTASQPNLILDSQIRQQFGAESWMLDVPELRVILEKATAGSWNQAQINTAVQGTQWYQTHSQAQRDFVALAANNPAELDFNNKGSQAAAMFMQVQNDATKNGLTLDPTRLQKIALDALQFRWNDAEISKALSSEISYNPTAATGGLAGQNDAGSLIQQLKTTAAQYFQNPDPTTLTTWAQQIVAGSQTMDTFSKYLADQASSKYSGMAPQIAQGLTPQQITSGLRSSASSLMEVQPSQIDFVNDPLYQKMLDYVPPGDKTGTHRLMTQSEANTYLRSQPQWGTTQQARDQVGNQAMSILSKWGQIA